MSGLPTEMVDRWQDRPEAAPGEGFIYWHMLVGGDPEVVAMAQEAQRRLAGFGGFHMTPLNCLHITVLIAGAATEISQEHVHQMAEAASRELTGIVPITVTLGKILYHPEAVMLAVRPADALVPVLEAAKKATEEVMGRPGRSGSKLESWTPHITIAYSIARQSAGPIISALGRSLPERRVQVRAISLVSQRGPERDWDWHVEATVR